jgi:hypothetical protein
LYHEGLCLYLAKGVFNHGKKKKEKSDRPKCSQNLQDKRRCEAGQAQGLLGLQSKGRLENQQAPETVT